MLAPESFEGKPFSNCSGSCCPTNTNRPNSLFCCRAIDRRLISSCLARLRLSRLYFFRLLRLALTVLLNVLRNRFADLTAFAVALTARRLAVL